MKNFAKQIMREFPKTDVQSIDLVVGVLPIAIVQHGIPELDLHPGIRYYIASNKSGEKPFIGSYNTDTFWEYWGIGLVFELLKRSTPQNVHKYLRERGVVRAKREAQILQEHYGDLVRVKYK
jgi:hypothetical protein